MDHCEQQRSKGKDNNNEGATTNKFQQQTLCSKLWLSRRFQRRRQSLQQIITANYCRGRGQERIFGSSLSTATHRHQVKEEEEAKVQTSRFPEQRWQSQ